MPPPELVTVQIDPTVSLGAILGVIVNASLAISAGYAAWRAFKSRIDTVIENQSSMMMSLSNRFQKHEDRDEELFEKVQSSLTDIKVSVARFH